MKIYKLKKDFDFSGSIIPTGTLFYLFKYTAYDGRYETMVPIKSKNGLGITVYADNPDYPSMNNSTVEKWEDWFEFVENKKAVDMDNNNIKEASLENYKEIVEIIANIKYLNKRLSLGLSSESYGDDADNIKEQELFLKTAIEEYEEFTGEKFE